MSFDPKNRAVVFKNWRIFAPIPTIAQQYDNLSRTLLFSGEIPEEYSWDLLVQFDDKIDIIPLQKMEDGIGVVLTKDQLCYTGKYQLQLRGTNGEVVRHTNIIEVTIPKSISGDGEWPEIPSEFTELEQSAKQAAEDAKAAAEEAAAAQSAIENLSVVVQTLPAGELASVEKIPLENGLQLAFKIPQGEPGEVPIFSAEAFSIPYGEAPTVSIEGSELRPVIKLGIPEGKPGESSARESLPTLHIATLAASDWVDSQQQVLIPGIKSDDMAQIVTIFPYPKSAMEGARCGVFCMKQSDGALTFSCQETPSSDLKYYIAVQDVQPEGV